MGSSAMVFSALCRGVGRIIFASIFIMSAIHHSQDIKGTAKMIHPEFVAKLNVEGFKNVGLTQPPVEIAAMAACALMGMGGVFIATGLLPRIGGVFVLIFLFPATYYQHFLPMQAAKDEQTKTIEMIMVMKNVALMGAALMLMGYAGEVQKARKLGVNADGKASKNKSIRKENAKNK